MSGWPWTNTLRCNLQLLLLVFLGFIVISQGIPLQNVGCVVRFGNYYAAWEKIIDHSNLILCSGASIKAREVYYFVNEGVSSRCGVNGGE